MPVRTGLQLDAENVTREGRRSARDCATRDDGAPRESGCGWPPGAPPLRLRAAREIESHRRSLNAFRLTTGAEAHRSRGSIGIAGSRRRDRGPGRDGTPTRITNAKTVLLDVAHRPAAQSQGANDSQQVPLDQRDVGALDRDVRPGPHRDPDLRGRERGSVVDPVPRHRDPPPLRLKPADDFELTVRQDLGDDLASPIASRRPRVSLVISVTITILCPPREPVDGLRSGLDGVGDPQESGHASVHRSEERRRPASGSG